MHYLFGGNPGSVAGTKVRLDDLWALRLLRPAAAGVRAAARRAIREAAFRELAADPRGALAALEYLRTDVRAVTDIDDPEQVGNTPVVVQSQQSIIKIPKICEISTMCIIRGAHLHIYNYLKNEKKRRRGRKYQCFAKQCFALLSLPTFRQCHVNFHYRWRNFTR